MIWLFNRIIDLLCGFPDAAPRWLRRVVILTFPVSFPLLSLAAVAALFFALPESMIRGAVGYAKRMWE